MIGYADITGKVKAWTGAFLSVVAVGVVLWNWGGLLHTDAEAQVHVDDFVDYQTRQLAADERSYKSDIRDRADRVQREIDRLDYQLLDENLARNKRTYLTNKRTDMVNNIACIRDETC